MDAHTTPATTTSPDRALSPAEAACTACSHAHRHGWWGVDGDAEHHCGDCHRYWSSHREAHCAGCCRHFASNAAFDAHRLGDVCHDPETLSRKDGRPRFQSRSGRLGTTWVLVNYRELPDFTSLR